MAARTLRKDIEAVLRKEGEPMKAKALIQRLKDVANTTESGVRGELAKMKGRGDLVQPRYGYYSLPTQGDGVQENPAPPAGEAREVRKLYNEDGIERGRIASLFERKITLTIYTDVRPQAGDGRVVYPDEARQTATVPRGFITEVIGFTPPREVGLMFVTGDSMEPTLQQDDMVIYEPLEYIPSGGVYVLLLDGQLIVKRVDPLPGGGYTLISDNTSRGYPQRTIVPAEGGGSQLVLERTGSPVDLRAVGKVIWPRRDTDRMHIQQVTRIIRGITQGGDGAVDGLPEVP